MIDPVTAGDFRRALAALRRRLFATERLVGRLRGRLREVLDCRDPRCSLCARCVAAVREEEGTR